MLSVYNDVNIFNLFFFLYKVTSPIAFNALTWLKFSYRNAHTARLDF